MTLPLAAPGIMASAIFVFLESLDEFTGTYFVGVPDVTTLPLLLFTASMEGNYQIASITALILLVPSVGFMLFIERFLKADVLAKVGSWCDASALSERLVLSSTRLDSRWMCRLDPSAEGPWNGRKSSAGWRRLWPPTWSGTAPDGRRRGRHPRPAQGPAQAVRRADDRGAPRTHRQADGRRRAGGVRERGRCRPLAVEIQRAMAEREPGVAGDQRLRFRVGVNLGDVIIEGDDIYGDGVNIAARLEGLAEPGGIVISGTAFDHARNKAQAGFAFSAGSRSRTSRSRCGLTRCF